MMIIGIIDHRCAELERWVVQKVQPVCWARTEPWIRIQIRRSGSADCWNELRWALFNEFIRLLSCLSDDKAVSFTESLASLSFRFPLSQIIIRAASMPVNWLSELLRSAPIPLNCGSRILQCQSLFKLKMSSSLTKQGCGTDANGSVAAWAVGLLTRKSTCGTGSQQCSGRHATSEWQFLRVLRKVAVVDNSKVLFTYKEVTSHLSQYILDSKDRFFDDRNIKIAHVERRTSCESLSTYL